MLLVLDSGIGGLSVAAAIRRRLPGAGMTYLADAAAFPYGDLDDAALTDRLLRLVEAAVARVRPRAVVVACNTASTVALAALRARLPLPFIGCVPPIKPAAACSRSGHIGLLATPATVRRPYVEELVSRYAEGCTVHSHGSPVLATLAEAAFRGEAVDTGALGGELAALFGQPGAEAIDVVVLGCTHYGFLLPDLRALAPAVPHWLDPADAVARQVGVVLGERGPTPGPSTLALTTAPLPVPTLHGLADHGFTRLETLVLPPRSAGRGPGPPAPAGPGRSPGLTAPAASPPLPPA